jgi:hypothetical protein
MQAAFISYAIFTAVILLLVIVVFIIVGVRSLQEFLRRRQARTKNSGNGPSLGP